MRMRLVMTLVGVIVCSTVTAFGQQVPRMDGVAPEYQTFRTLSRAEVVEVYAGLPGTTRQELWTMHLVTFLREHPELDIMQRGVVLEALGLLATGVLDTHPSDPRFRELGGNEIDRVVARAKDLLPSDLVQAAFYRLNDPAAAKSTRFGRVETNVVECDCSSIDGCPGYTCETGGPRFCTPVISYNCGPFYTHACDGICLD